MGRKFEARMAAQRAEAANLRVGEATEAEAAEQPAEYSITREGGRLSLIMAGAFLALAVIAYFWAEADWFLSTQNLDSVGVGISGYHAISFIRAGILAVISVAFAGISVGVRNYALKGR